MCTRPRIIIINLWTPRGAHTLWESLVYHWLLGSTFEVEEEDKGFDDDDDEEETKQKQSIQNLSTRTWVTKMVPEVEWPKRSTATKKN